jgi:hypothetical protein
MCGQNFQKGKGIIVYNTSLEVTVIANWKKAVSFSVKKVSRYVSIRPSVGGA